MADTSPVAIASIQAITAFDRPELAPYATMRMQEAHWRQGIFVAEGEKVVRRLLESRLPVLSVLLPPGWLEPLRLLIEQRPEAVAVFTAEKRLLEHLTGFTMYQGLMAVGRRPAALSVADALAARRGPRLWAAVDGLTNAENLGALVRNCVAFNVQALLVPPTSSHPYLRRAVRAAMGTVFHLPVVDVDDLVDALLRLRAAGVRCVAAHPHEHGKILPDTDLGGDVCVLFGSEGYGLSPAVRAACDDCAAVPMPPEVDSLNVGAAAAVFLYEANRQRRWS
jgi:tRNA G18 (ribose-2'-O)-methylase SpoU